MTFENTDQLKGALIQAGKNYQDGWIVDREYHFDVKRCTDGYGVVLSYHLHTIDAQEPDPQEPVFVNAASFTLPPNCSPSQVDDEVFKAMKLIPEGEAEIVYRKRNRVA